MLVTEISTARRIGEQDAVALLQSYLDKAGLTLPPVL
jgi:hypothetical protein